MTEQPPSLPECILPPNQTPLEAALDVAAAARLATIPHLVRTTANPATIPTCWLPWLAWAWRVENWSSGWTDQQKRQSIAASCEIHRHKGTIGALRAALYALNIGVQVVEWFEESPRKAPYTFRLQLSMDGATVTPATWATIMAIVATTKNARSWLTSADITAQPTATTCRAACAHYGLILDIPAP
ncbi:phage tail protein I [Formicincola oecophyllae]|uniref:phage tail protein I n=1 Tax=Formicincola oecophyllae TaxID=2558361 RepID=UPI00143D2DE1|nr:phage tail protein I [Formicincola oecophyllae]